MWAGCWPVAPDRLTTTFVVSAPSFVSVAVPDSVEPACGAIFTFTESAADAAAAKPRTPKSPMRAKVRLPMSRMVHLQRIEHSGAGAGFVVVLADVFTVVTFRARTRFRAARHLRVSKKATTSLSSL